MLAAAAVGFGHLLCGPDSTSLVGRLRPSVDDVLSHRREVSIHPPKDAYRASAGSVFDLTGVFWSAGKDRQRGGRWRSSPG
jgi:hypothetical protein